MRTENWTGLQPRFPLLPPDAEVLGKELALAREDGHVTFYNASGPIHTCNIADTEALLFAAAMFCEMGLARPTVLAKALGLGRRRLYEIRKRMRKEGAKGAKSRRRGPRRPSKLIGEVLEKAQKYIDQGFSNRNTAAQIGVSEGTIRAALNDGRLQAKEDAASAGELGDAVEAGQPKQPSQPRERSEADETCAGGVAVKRVGDRVHASMGLVKEAGPTFKTAEAVAKAGVLIALPALLGQGMLELGDKVYGQLKNGFFGLQSVLLTLAFMALLRIKTIENLTSHAPGEFGMILGLDRAPEIKTLRRKLKEIADRGEAFQYVWELAREWSRKDSDALGYLYCDGHVRPYHGNSHRLPKAFVPQRRLSVPATTDFWINDANAEPLFFVTAEANDHMLKVLDNDILDRIRELVGEERRVTLIFDREGWSPASFKKWHEKKIDVITYRRGSYDPWGEDCFSDYEVEVNGSKETYKLAERKVEICKGFSVREVRRLCNSGHETSIITTREDLGIVEIARRMFARWKQENYFRYMRHEFNFDHMPTLTVEDADPERQVPNPEKKEKKKELDKARKRLDKAQIDYGKQTAKNAGLKRVTKRALAKAEQSRIEILESERLCAEIAMEYKAMPKHVAIKVILAEKEIVRLEKERKIFTDAIKMIAYRAETQLANLVGPLLPHKGDEARSFLKEVFQLPADLVPDEDNARLLVRFHGMANWRSNRVLRELCHVINEHQISYPGTNMQIVYEAISAA